MSARSGLFDAAIVALGFLLVLSGVWAMVASRTYVSISRSGQTPPAWLSVKTALAPMAVVGVILVVCAVVVGLS